MASSCDTFSLVITSFNVLVGLVALIDPIFRQIPSRLIQFRVAFLLYNSILVYRTSDSVANGDTLIQIGTRIINLSNWWFMTLTLFVHFGIAWSKIVPLKSASLRHDPKSATSFRAAKILGKHLRLFPYYKAFVLTHTVVNTFVFLLWEPRNGIIVATELGDLIGSLVIILPGAVVLLWLARSLHSHRKKIAGDSTVYSRTESGASPMSSPLTSVNESIATTAEAVELESPSPPPPPPVPQEAWSEKPPREAWSERPRRTSHHARHPSSVMMNSADPSQQRDFSETTSTSGGSSGDDSSRAPKKKFTIKLPKVLRRQRKKDYERRLWESERNMILFGVFSFFLVAAYSPVSLQIIMDSSKRFNENVVVEGHPYTPGAPEEPCTMTFIISVIVTRLGPLGGMYLARCPFVKTRSWVQERFGGDDASEAAASNSNPSSHDGTPEKQAERV